MVSRSLKLGTLSLLAAWGLLMLIGISGHLRWDNRLLWAPLVLVAVSFFLAVGSWEEEARRVPLVIVAASAFASLVFYTVGYVFLFLYSIPNR